MRRQNWKTLGWYEDRDGRQFTSRTGGGDTKQEEATTFLYNRSRKQRCWSSLTQGGPHLNSACRRRSHRRSDPVTVYLVPRPMPRTHLESIKLPHPDCHHCPMLVARAISKPVCASISNPSRTLLQSRGGGFSASWVSSGSRARATARSDIAAPQPSQVGSWGLELGIAPLVRTRGDWSSVLVCGNSRW